MYKILFVIHLTKHAHFKSCITIHTGTYLISLNKACLLTLCLMFWLTFFKKRSNLSEIPPLRLLNIYVFQEYDSLFF